MARDVFVTGGSGYLGRELTTALLERGHSVRALVRPGSERRLPPGCTPVFGDVLDRATFARQVPPSDTFVHLVGTSRPSPLKARQFREVDLGSAREAVAAAAGARVRHFVYVSVAQPAPVMRAYVQARAEAEETIRASGRPATILRPWYVLGPGHRWPSFLLPVYGLLEKLPATAETARRLGLVELPSMMAALVRAVEGAADGVRIVTVPEIRSTPPLTRP